jgi:hypothetical protein
MTVDGTRRQIFEEGWPTGWDTSEVTTGPLKLYLVFYPGDSGAPEFRRLVWSAEEVTGETKGQLERMRALWKGLSRYLNAGGSMDELNASIGECGQDLPLLDPPGFYLLGTDQDVECPRYVFISRDEKQIVDWHQDESVELMSRDEFEGRLTAEEQELDAEEELYADEFGDDR